jgi:nitrite reductase (NADH) small subunit
MAELSEPTRSKLPDHESRLHQESASEPSQAPDTQRRRTWNLVGETSDFPDGSARVVNVHGRSIGIVRVGAEFYAVRNTCPHQGAQLFKGGILKGTMLPSEPDELVYGMESLVIRCPLHGWEFDITSGNAVFGISNKRAVTYPIRIDEGRIFVLVGA